MTGTLRSPPVRSPRAPRNRPRKAVASAAAFLVAAAALLVAGPAAGQEAPGEGQAPVVVDSIAVRGVQRQSPAVVVSESGLQTGTPITYRDIQEAIRRLWATHQYEDIRVLARGGTRPEEPVILIVEVEERPYVARVDITGLEHASAGTVKDTVGLRGGQPYRPERVAEAKAYIRNVLSEEGIPFARIEDRLEDIPERENEYRLVLAVEEGQRVTVAEVDFTGNEHFTEADLRGAMDVKPEGFWWFRSGSYDASTFDDDLRQRLPEFYGSHGYLDFEVVRDTLVVDPETGKARIEVEIREGPQYRLADFFIEGNREFSTEDLRQYFDVGGGGLLASLGFGGVSEDGMPVFDVGTFREATQRVHQLYRNQGYIYAQVQPVVNRVDTPEGEPPQVEVGWNIQEGEPAYVASVSIEGNDYTYERVIRDQIYILPGDVYNEDLVIQSFQSISSLGFFETPLPQPEMQPDPETGDVHITFKVKEKQTGSINFGTAIGGATGIAGFIGYDQPNLFGQAKEGHLRWDFGRFANNLTLSYSDPALLDSRISGTLSLFSARDRFFRFSTGQRRRTGGSLRFGIPVPGTRRSRFIVGYSLSRTTYEQFDVADQSLFARPPGTQSTVTLGVSRRTLNHPIFPTAGSNQTFNVELNGGIFGGDGTFQKPTFEGSWWVPVGRIGGGQPGQRPIRFALGLSFRGGAVFGDASRFPFDRFWMGGVQFGQQLRGYEETEITPEGYVPRSARSFRDIDRLGDAYLSMTGEYAVRFNDNLSVSAFYDAGNVWRDPAEVNPARLMRGAGIGVQLVTPFGPLGLDYAYGFDRIEPGWQLHFRLGPGF